MDFDGTLARIVDDPASARPLPGATRVLQSLASVFRVVAVVSGRRASFLGTQLAAAAPGVRLLGLYGMEELVGGRVHLAPGLDTWAGPAAAVAAAARAEAPPGVGVEAKGVSVTLHWRSAPDAAPWVEAFARERAAATGLVLQPGRMAVELRPPVDIDKGSTTERLAAGCRAACFVGDDAGDLAAFAALDRLALGGVRVAKVAVADRESPAALVTTADVVVHGPDGAVALLRALAEAAGAPGAHAP